MRKPSMTIGALALVASFALAGVLAASGLGATARARHHSQGPTVTTALSASVSSVGKGVHDTATLSGLTGTSFTGDMVTYTVYPSIADCLSGASGTTEGSVSAFGNGPVAASGTFTPTSVGTYYWRASFNGADHTNPAASSDCSTEAMTATAANAPTVTTSLSASTATVGGTGVHDTATLAGLTGTSFTGDMVTYTVYSSLADCTAGTNGTSEGTASVAGNGQLAASSTFNPTSAGTYYWKASFNGADPTNTAATSDCSTEALTVTTPTGPPPEGASITTVLSASAARVGGVGVYDTATLSGLTGTSFTGDMVAYSVYPSLADCTAGTNGTSEGTATVSGNGAVAPSSTFTPTGPGTFYWQATFNGADHTNAAMSSSCSSEPLTVTTRSFPRGRRFFVCRPLFFGHRHHRFFICFRVGHHHLPPAGESGQGNGQGAAPDQAGVSAPPPAPGGHRHHHHDH